MIPQWTAVAPAMSQAAGSIGRDLECERLELTVLYILKGIQALQPSAIKGRERLANNSGHCVGKWKVDLIERVAG